MKHHVHVFPVDDSFREDPLEAWKEICIFGRRITYTGGEVWCYLECDGRECDHIDESPDVEIRYFDTNGNLLPSGEEIRPS